MFSTQDMFAFVIDLISSTNWGGTCVQAWSSTDALAKCNQTLGGENMDNFQTEEGEANWQNSEKERVYWRCQYDSEIQSVEDNVERVCSDGTDDCAAEIVPSEQIDGECIVLAEGHVRSTESCRSTVLKGNVDRSRHERHFCSLLPYFLLSWLQIFQLCLSFWTSSSDLVLF